MDREYWTNRIEAASNRRNYSVMPRDMERDAVRFFYAREVKNHIPNWIVGPRIKASKSETFAELKQAMAQVLDAWDSRKAKFAGVRSFLNP